MPFFQAWNLHRTLCIYRAAARSPPRKKTFYDSNRKKFSRKSYFCSYLTQPLRNAVQKPRCAQYANCHHQSDQCRHDLITVQKPSFAPSTNSSYTGCLFKSPYPTIQKIRSGMVISDKKRSSFISYSYISSLLSKFYAKIKNMQERTFFILCKPFSIGSFAEASHSLFSASALQNSIPECNHNRDVSTFSPVFLPRHPQQ